MAAHLCLTIKKNDIMDCVVKVWLKAKGIVGKDNPRETDCIVTEINGTIESVKAYYAIGKTFNMGLWYGGWKWVYEYGKKHKEPIEHEDNLMCVTKVFVLRNCETTDRFFSYLRDKYGWDCIDYFCEEEYEKFLSK